MSQAATIAAIHESAHAVTGLGVGLDLERVEVRPDGSGVCRWRMENVPMHDAAPDSAPITSPVLRERAARLDSWRSDPATFEHFLAGLRSAIGSPERIVAHLVMSRAAREAELRWGCHPAVAAMHAADDVLSDDVLLSTFGERAFYRADALATARAHDLVHRNWSEICKLASALLERGKLDGDEARRLLKGE